MKKKNLCPSCKNNLSEKKVDLPFFTHFKFYLLNKKNSYFICKACNLIINKNLTNKKLKFILTKNYSSLNLTQKSFKKNENFQKHDEQFCYLKKNRILNDGMSVLDIGCNKAHLIKKISKNIKKSICKGYDENPYVKKYLRSKGIFFDYKKNQTFKFDLIILSHSLMYFKNINKLIKLIQKNLSKDGKIFIENPNIENSPFYLLMGDQYYFFSIYSLQKIFFKFNFYLLNTNHSNSNSNFSTIFGKKRLDYYKFKKFNLVKSLKYLFYIKNYLKNLQKKNVIIFGTTVKAAFIHYFINKKVKYFADEENKNKFFNDIKVKHPRFIKKNDFVIVPLKEKKNILKNLKRKYLGNFKIV